MRVRDIPTTDLVPAPYNPREALRPGDDGYERLARSIDAFDLVEPLVWNERTGHVVGGHQRLTILKARGDAAVPCVVVDLDETAERALNVALNNEKVGGDWDPAKLVDLLAGLGDLPDFDATLTGFTGEELTDLVLGPPPGPLPPEPGDAPETAVRVEFGVEPDRWETLRPAFDAFAAEHSLMPRVVVPTP